MKETLCWKCSVPGTGGCSWDREFVPVRGWIATPTRIWLNYKQTSMRSYCVKSCPLFRPEKPRACYDLLGGPRKMSEESFEACLSQGLDDATIAAMFDLEVDSVRKRRARRAKRMEKEEQNGTT